MRATRRGMGQVFLGLALLMAFGAVGPPAVQGAEEARVGLLLPFSGPWAKFGNEMAIAMEIARELINQSGGVQGGKQVVFVKGDIPNPTAATSEANRLIRQEKMQVLLGTFAAPLGVAVSAVAAKEGVVHWEAFAGADIITKRGSKWIFRNGAPSSVYGITMLDAVREVVAPKLGSADLKALRIGTLWENRPWGAGVVEGIRARAKELGITLHLDEGYDQFATDVTPIVQKVKDANLDVLLTISYFNDAVLIQKKSRELNMYVKALLAASAGYALPEFAQTMGKAANGIMLLDLPSRINKAGLQPEAARLHDAFFDTYRKRAGHDPAGHAVASFTTAYLLLNDVLRSAKGMTAEDIRQAALALDKPLGFQINGWGVKFSQFDQPKDPKDAGQNLRSFVPVSQWQDGRHVALWPRAVAVGEPILIPLPTWDKR